MSEKRNSIYLYILIFASSLPFLFLVSRPELSDSQYPLRALALYASSLLGFFGMTMLVWQLILGTRSVAGLFTANFADKIKVHKNLGIYGTLLIFLHPLLITIGYGYGLLYSFLPDLSSGYEKAVTYGRIAFYLLIIIWFTSALLKSRIKYRPWKYLHYSSYPVLIFSLLHIPTIGPSFDSQFVQFYWYITVFIVIVCSLLRLRHLFGFGKLSFRLVQKQEISPGVYSLLLTPKNNKYFSIKPGQFVYLQFTFMGEEHPFSVLDFDNDSGKMLIVYKEFGSFTKKLSAKLIPGEIVLIDGPYGNFLNKMTENNIFIAGGVGFTPFYKTAVSGQPGNIFIRAARKNADLCFDDQLKKTLGSRYIRLLSDEDSRIDADSFNGYFKSELLSRNIDNYDKYTYFICGPDKMIESVEKELEKIGIPKSSIHSEKFGF